MLNSATIESRSDHLFPDSYSEKELIIHCNFPNPRWIKAGYLKQSVQISSEIEIILQTKLIYLNQYQPILLSYSSIPYKLKFQPVEWLPNYTINLFKLNMPLTFEPVQSSSVASSATSATVPLSITSVSIVAANPNRKKLIIANNSNQDMFLDLDATASAADHAIKIPKVSASGFIASYELEGYTGVASAIWAAAGTGAALVRELV